MMSKQEPRGSVGSGEFWETYIDEQGKSNRQPSSEPKIQKKIPNWFKVVVSILLGVLGVVLVIKFFWYIMAILAMFAVLACGYSGARR